MSQEPPKVPWSAPYSTASSQNNQDSPNGESHSFSSKLGFQAGGALAWGVSRAQWMTGRSPYGGGGGAEGARGRRRIGGRSF